MTVTFEKITTLPIEKTFEVLTDYGSFQNKLNNFFPSIRVISVRPNTTLVEQHVRLAEKELVVMAKHITEKPTLHETLIVGGDIKGSHIIEKYEETQLGTKISVTINIKIKGTKRLSGFFNKGRFENEFSKIYDQLILIAES
ncbi:MAG: polyketide cyclase [Candidatus Nitrosomaritimum yanchengensis]